MKKQYVTALALLLVLVVPSLLKAQDFYGINCGTESLFFTNSQGDVFIPDIPYPNGYGYGLININSRPFGIDRTTNGEEGMDSLYFYRREGDFSYVFQVTDGWYAIKLHFEEKTYHGEYFRNFSVSIEDNTVIENLDIFEVTGMYYCLPMRFLVECNDNLINVDFTSDTSEATLSAISVERIYEDIVPPPMITGLTSIDGYNMNVLYWDYCIEDDLAGYRVYRREAGGSWELLTPDTHPLYRYLDYTAQAGITYEYVVATEDLWGNESSISDPVSATALPPEVSNLSRYEMEITEENIYLMNIDIDAKIWVDADLTLEDVYYPGSEVRYRGGSSLWRPKKNYKLSVPQGVTHNQRDDFNCNGEGVDPSILINRLGYSTFDVLGLANPMAQHVYLERNGEFIGVYIDLEQVDNHFLERVGWSKSGNLYKCVDVLRPLPSMALYQAYYEIQNHDTSSMEDIIDFITWIDTADTAEFRADVGKRCDVNGYIDYIVGLIANSDDDFGYNNYFMYNNPADNRWYFIGWDHNLSYWNTSRGIDYGTRENPLPFFELYYNRLHDRLLHDELFNYSYCKKMERFLENGFSPEENMGRIDSFYEEIEEDAIRDIYKRGRERPDLFLNSRNSLYIFAHNRVDSLMMQIPDYIMDPDRAPYFRINEIQSRNQTIITDEAGDYDPWMEIANISAVELDMSVFILHYGTEFWSFPDEAVIDEFGHLIIWLDGETGEGTFHTSFALLPESGTLWLESNHGVTADSVEFPALDFDQVWARIIDGTGNWVDNLSPSPGMCNDYIDPSALVINEFMADNETFIPDPAGGFDDWVEIYNTSVTDTIPVGGLYLTDNLSNPHRWALPDTTILPGGFLIIWCDNDLLAGKMHAAFKLGAGGEQVGLFDRDGITPVDTLTYPEQEEDMSWGRYPDGADNWGVRAPTPGDNMLVSTQTTTLPVSRWSFLFRRIIQIRLIL